MAEPRAPSLVLDGVTESVERRAGPSGKAVDDRTEFVQQLFERHRASLARYLGDLLLRPEDVDDTIQETYVRLLTARDLDRSAGRIRAYIFRVATNLACDRFRRRRARGIAVDPETVDLVSEDPRPEHIVDFDQGVDIVKRALMDLAPRCRQVFLLRASEHMGYEDIAARLGVSKRTVEREMQHALEVFRRRLRA